MQLGYIHIGKEEQNRVMQMLKRLTEPGALDEIGIGRIRDAFADQLFPGTSTLQKHAKYFSLMPQVYQRAAARSYNRTSEVQAEVIRLERQMTEKLWDGSNHAPGITGSEIIGHKDGSYVKYDPAYIYNSGLRTYEIVRCNSVINAIYALSKRINSKPKALRDGSEDVADDSEELSGRFQPWDIPQDIDYDFTCECSLTLTPSEKDFIRRKILHSRACQGSLFAYLLEHPEITRLNKFPWIISSELPDDLRTLYDCAIAFSEFVYLLRLRYYYLYSRKSDDAVLEELNLQKAKFNAENPDIRTIINASSSTHKSTKQFCVSCAEAIKADEIDRLDDLIIRRERQLKGTRSKIGANGYYGNGAARLNYRWETVKVYLDELTSNELKYG